MVDVCFRVGGCFRVVHWVLGLLETSMSEFIKLIYYLGINCSQLLD